MNVNGAISISHPPQRVTDALHDPAVLQGVLPACTGVDCLGPGRFRAKIARKVGLLTLRVAPDIVLVAAPDGTGLDMSITASSHIAGSFSAQITLTLLPEPSGTRLSWDGQVVATGMAQRLLAERQDQIQARVMGLFTSLKSALADG